MSLDACWEYSKTRDRPMPLSIIVLAAGHGTRMRSSVPKILHLLAGRPLISRVVDTARSLAPAQLIIVHGQQRHLLDSVLNDPLLLWVAQPTPLGTGDAVRCALPQLSLENRVLVLLGDVPLITTETLQRFLEATPLDAVGLMTVVTPDPTGLGRILRDDAHQVVGIVEEKDASAAERAITEINTGFFIIPVPLLQQWLPQLTQNNAQGEFYLTAIVPLAIQAGVPVVVSHPIDKIEIQGVNDKCQLAYLERSYQRREAEFWLRRGVSIMDPYRFDVRGTVSLMSDVTVDLNVIFEGVVTVGARSRIGANCILKDCTIAEDVEILPFSHIDGANIGHACRIGPFARIRPKTILAADVRIGNFVEIKESTLAEYARVNHLSYIGNTTMGDHVNIGAGTIVCNYDGVNKHQTMIESGVFVGCGSQLVAPVCLEKNSTIGAGTVLTHTAPADKLTLRRAPQKTIANWKRPQRTENKE